jgi:type I restriction enzyme R subunit
MDIVLPDPIANPYKEDLNRLGEIHARAKQRYRDDSMNLEGCGEKVRNIIQTHLSSSGIEVLNDDPVSVMDKSEFDARVDSLKDDEARASEMQHAIKYELNVRHDEDPVHFGSLQERVEELIERYRQKRLSDKEIIEELREVLDELRSRTQMAESKGLADTTELSLYHALSDVLQSSDRGIDEDQMLELTGKLINSIEEIASVVEWKQKVQIQQQMRKQVKIELFKSEIDLTKEERDELTNRVIELARAHYE